jgi:branched-chain amino acid transport system ATP-binding protein
MNLLEVKQFTVSYGPVKAVRGIDLTVESGEIVAIIGSNGAGKSSTLNSICGLIPSESGQLLFDGEDIKAMPTRKRVELGISLVPEGRLVFPDMTIMENLEMGFLRNADKKLFPSLVERTFESFPILKERKRQLAGTLSGGEQQMLAIGRGLMSNPKLLMLDEPSLGLSPVMVSEVARIIEYLNVSFGVSILLVEQNALMALEISRRAYVLEIGNVSLSGSSSDLIESDSVKRAYLGI